MIFCLCTSYNYSCNICSLLGRFFSLALCDPPCDFCDFCDLTALLMLRDIRLLSSEKKWLLLSLLSSLWCGSRSAGFGMSAGESSWVPRACDAYAAAPDGMASAGTLVVD